MSLFEELKRRHVFRVSAAYVVMAWLVLQVADVILNNIDAPGWIFLALLVVLSAGLPVASFLAWAYELTPGGIAKDSISTDHANQVSHGHRFFGAVIIIGLGVGFAAFILMTRTTESVTPPMAELLDRPSVVVLPFSNATGDADHDYLSFGLTDELIAGLQSFDDIPVLSRSTTLEFEGSGVSPDEFATTLGASYRVEGSVAADDDGIRVLASLSNVGGNQIWAKRFFTDLGTAGIFDLTDELAAMISRAVLDSEIQRVRHSDRPPVDAWEHYIKGLEVALNFEPGRYDEARHHLDQAVSIAPDMAEAWWAIGELEISRYVAESSLNNTGPEELHRIIGYFRKSHELSPYYAAACGCLGYLLTAVGEVDEARAVYAEALEANPRSPEFRVDYVSFLMFEGRYEEATRHLNVAERMGPSSFGKSAIWINRAVVALAKDDTSAALDAVNRSRFIHRNVFYMPVAVPILYIVSGPDDAAKLMTEMKSVFPNISIENPAMHVLIKPIDDILTSRREDGNADWPASVREIYAELERL
jgi:TolB-like protein/Tfp pilus assembly protein PilF